MRSRFIYIAVAVVLSSCWKYDKPELAFPAETRDGLNTCGCYINGVAFIPSTTLFGNVRPINAYYNHDSTTYYKAGFLSINVIDARYELDVAGSILMQKLGVFGEGEYTLNHVLNCPQPYDCDGGGYQHASVNRFYYIQTGKLTITRLDTINRIISGRFNFIAKDTLGHTKEISNGFFDAKYVGP